MDMNIDGTNMFHLIQHSYFTTENMRSYRGLVTCPRAQSQESRWKLKSLTLSQMEGLTLGSPRSRLWDKDSSASGLLGRWSQEAQGGHELSHTEKEKYHRVTYMEAPQVALVVKNPTINGGDTRDLCLIPGSGRSPGRGHGNPLQYACLENPMDRRAYWVPVHKVAKNQTWWSDFTRTHHL